jgi:hypothetical protein
MSPLPPFSTSLRRTLVRYQFYSPSFSVRMCNPHRFLSAWDALIFLPVRTTGVIPFRTTGVIPFPTIFICIDKPKFLANHTYPRKIRQTHVRRPFHNQTATQSAHPIYSNLHRQIRKPPPAPTYPELGIRPIFDRRRRSPVQSCLLLMSAPLARRKAPHSRREPPSGRLLRRHHGAFRVSSSEV